jgi:hypothetical protein
LPFLDWNCAAADVDVCRKLAHASVFAKGTNKRLDGVSKDMTSSLSSPRDDIGFRKQYDRVGANENPARHTENAKSGRTSRVIAE